MELPDWVAFEKMVAALRKKYGAARASAKTSSLAASIAMPKNLPDDFKAVVEAVRQSVIADLPKFLDSSLPARALFAKDSDDQTPPLFGRYFWVEDMASEVDRLLSVQLADPELPRTSTIFHPGLVRRESA